MKLLELEIARFGQFSDRRLSFGEDGIHVIYGANEAGKTTLLEFIRQLLFGFSHRYRYANLHADDKKPAGQALLLLRDGRRMQFRRHKGRKDTVHGNFEPDGEPVDEAELTTSLENATADLFANVFGFSLAELSAGEKSLQAASLNEVLFGGAIGNVTAFRQLQQSLHEEHARLLTSQSRTREFDVLLDTIAGQRRDLRTAQFQPHEYRLKLAESRQCEHRVDELRAQLEQLRRDQSHVQRLIEAFPLWNQQQHLQQQLDELTLPADLPADLRERYVAARDDLERATHDLEDVAQQQLSIQQQLDASVVDERMLAVEAEIRHLQRDVGNFQRLTAQLPELQNEAAAKQLAVLADIQRLDPQWDLEMLQQLHLPLAEREQVVALAAEYESLQQKQTELEAQLPALQRDLETASRRLDELSGIDRIPQLESLVAAHAQYGADLRAKAEVESAVRRLQPDIAALRERLGNSLNVKLDNPLGLTVPLESTVSEFRQQFERLEHEVQQRQSELQMVQQDCGNKQRALEELDEQAHVPDRQELDSCRAHRDEGWRLIRKKYVRQKSVEDDVRQWLKDPDDSLPDAYELAVREADHVADLRQEKAELVARHEALERELDHLRGRCQRAEETLDDTVTRREAVHAQWRERWSACRFEPLSPSEMQEWLGLHALLVDKHESQQLLQLQLRDLNDRLGDFQDELATASAAHTFEDRMADVQTRVEQARQAEVERATWNQQLHEKRGELEHVQQSLAGLQAALQDWKQRWHAALAHRGWATQWNPRLVTQIVHAVGEARARQSEAEGLLRAAQDAQQTTQDFRQRVSQLCQRLAPELNQLPADAAAQRLSEQLEGAVSAQATRASLTQQLQQLKHRAAANTQVQRAANTQRQQLLQLASATHEAEMWKIIRRAETAHQLRHDIDRVASQLNTLRGAEAEESFRQRLEHADPDELPARLETLTEEIRETEEQYQTAVGERRVMRDEVAKLDGSSTALDMQVELESSYGKLAAVVDRWAPLAMAEALLQQAMQRFQREHQPRIMQQVERLFAELTAGRYVELRRQLDDDNSLQVRDEKQGWKQPEQLSRGTREQLYLAIRLAYVSDYCQRAEPLPLIIDDALVNFDDQRCDQALRVLHQLSASLQILFLTCRQTMVDRLQRVVPEIELIALGDAPAEQQLGLSART